MNWSRRITRCARCGSTWSRPTSRRSTTRFVPWRVPLAGRSALTSQKLVTMKRVAQDGVRVRASAGAASFHREKTLKEHLVEAEEQLRRLTDELDQDTQASSRRQKAAKERAAKHREDRVAEALRQLRELQETKPKEDEKKNARASETDPDARVMKLADGGFRPAFNVQFATDVDTQIIVGVDVTNIGSDAGQMLRMVEQLGEHYGHIPPQMLVDGGFATTKAIDQNDQGDRSGRRARPELHRVRTGSEAEGSDP